MARKAYTARFERDEDNYWSVTVQVAAKRVAISDGQTLPTARRRIRQAVALLLDVDESAFDLVEEFALPSDALQALTNYKSIREESLKVQRALESARLKAAKALTERGVSLRDAGDMLDLTGQRVQQVLATQLRHNARPTVRVAGRVAARTKIGAA